MTALIAIGWAVALLFAVGTLQLTLGDWQLTNMFPEGKRWYHPFGRLLAMALFAAVVLANPFNGWLAGHYA